MYSIIPDGDVVCTKWRATQAGETCWSTWTKVAKLVEKDFLRLNPGVDCNALTNATYLCVEGDLKGKAKAVPNPSWEKVCTDTRTVQTGETCWSVWTKAGLTDVEFYSLNPGIDCNLLIPSISKVCLKRDYVTPSVTTPSATSTSTTAKALAIPTIAVVSAPPCAAYHIVEDGETCYTIWTNAGLSNTEFLALNPTVDCGWLQVGGTSVCTKRGDGPSSASTTIGAAPTASTTAKATTTPKPPSSINPRVTGNCVSGTFPLNNPSSWIINEKAAPGSSFPFEHDPSKYPMMGTGQGISFESDRVSFTHQNPPNNNVIIGVHTRWIRYAKITLRVAASAVPGLHVSVKTDSQTGDVIVADFSPAMPNMMAPNALFKNRLCGPANWGIVPQFTNLHTLEFDWKRSSLAWKVDGVAQRTLIPGSAAAKATAPGWQANPTGELPKDPSLFMFSLSVNGAVDTNRYPISSRSASFADLTIQCYDNNDKAVPEWPVGAKDYTYPGAVAKRDVADGEMFEPAELDLVQMMIERRSENVETATEDEMSVPGPASFRMGAPAARLRATPKCTTHLVRAGEGCEDIAGIYRISVADYKEWNNESQCPPEEGSVVCVSSSVVKRGRRSNVDEL
ncbi:hypothetical protein DFJ77DRAFT_264623 [Powellomyces hirtus]|nr:hypothetical protein DFJ77DRAFT_264623 [Powellomyces hirtus]